METGSKQEIIDLSEDRQRRKKTMTVSLYESAFAVLIFSFQQAFYIPYLNALGASKFAIGIGAGIPSIAAGLIQFFVPYLLKHGRNPKKIVVIATFLHALFFLPFAFSYMLCPKHPIWMTIAAITMSAISVGFAATFWADWIGYIVPARMRGRYFSFRTRITTIIQMIATLIAGRMLDTFTGKVLLVFTIIWVIAFLTRSVSAALFLYHHVTIEMRNRGKIEKVNFMAFIKDIFTTPFGRFVVGMSLFNLGLNFADPFYPIHMLNNLNISYFKYTLIHLMPTLTTLVMLGMWGRLCDRVGYVLPMRFSSILIVAPILTWVVTCNYNALLISHIIRGVALGGFVLASFNHTLESIGKTERLGKLTYLNAINFISIGLGAMLGGLGGMSLPKMMNFQLQTVFLVGGVICFIAALIVQTVPDDKKSKGKLSSVERFFFDPRYILKIGGSLFDFNREKGPS